MIQPNFNKIFGFLFQSVFLQIVYNRYVVDKLSIVWDVLMSWTFIFKFYYKFVYKYKQSKITLTSRYCSASSDKLWFIKFKILLPVILKWNLRNFVIDLWDINIIWCKLIHIICTYRFCFYMILIKPTYRLLFYLTCIMSCVLIVSQDI